MYHVSHLFSLCITCNVLRFSIMLVNHVSVLKIHACFPYLPKSRLIFSEHTKFADSHYYNPNQCSKIARPHCHKLTYQNKENMHVFFKNRNMINEHYTKRSTLHVYRENANAKHDASIRTRAL